MIRRFPAVLLTAAGVACGEAASESATAAVRDSAGIAIVENPAAAAERELPWTIAAEPSLVIGVAEGAPEYQLYQVTAVTRLPDGRIAVVNAGSGQVRFYGPAGQFLDAVGRPGDGPGEFRGMVLVGVAADHSLLLYDMQAQRFTWVSAVPAIGRMFPSAGPGGARLRVTPRGRLATGEIVASGPALVEGMPSTGTRDPLQPLLRLGPDGTVGDTIGRFTNEPRHVLIEEEFISIARVPFGTRTRFAVGPDAIHAGTADGWEIRTYDGEGRPVRITRLDRPRRPVTDADREAWIARGIAESSLQSAALRRQYEAMEIPEWMPAYGRVLRDPDDFLWVEEYRAPGDDGPPRWLVVDPGGRVLGAITFPAGLSVLEVGTDYVLGLAHDELDAQQVAMHRLDRGEGR